MNIIIRANKEQFKEAKDMCEAIVELFQDEIDAARKEALIVGRNENLHITIKACRDFGVVKEKVYELLVNDYKLTEEQAEEYIEKNW